MSNAQFRVSSRCGSGGCVEVALLPSGGAVIRSTLSGIHLAVTAEEWRDFLAAAKEGKFDVLV